VASAEVGNRLESNSNAGNMIYIGNPKNMVQADVADKDNNGISSAICHKKARKNPISKHETNIFMKH